MTVAGSRDDRSRTRLTEADLPPIPPASAQHQRLSLIIAVLALVLCTAVMVALLLWPTERIAAPPQWEQLAPPLEVRLHPWRWIVIHHSATPGGSSVGIDRVHHEQRGWDGIGYHFVIGNGDPLPVGGIEATFRWRGQGVGAHAGAGPEQADYNRDGIGVCLIGSFSEREPDEAQMQRCADLCAILIHRFPSLSIDRIIGHRAVPGKHTDCPGKVSVERLRYLTRAAIERHGWTTR